MDEAIFLLDEYSVLYDDDQRPIFVTVQSSTPNIATKLGIWYLAIPCTEYGSNYEFYFGSRLLKSV